MHPRGRLRGELAQEVMEAAVFYDRHSTGCRLWEIATMPQSRSEDLRTRDDNCVIQSSWQEAWEAGSSGVNSGI